MVGVPGFEPVSPIVLSCGSTGSGTDIAILTLQISESGATLLTWVRIRPQQVVAKNLRKKILAAPSAVKIAETYASSWVKKALLNLLQKT